MNMPQAPETLNQFAALIQVISDLRGPGGCPWDQEQTHNTLTQYAIEEVHEMVEAIESSDDNHMKEELGDVLFQVVLHAQIAQERNAFKIEDVIEGIVSKIVRRHPHVFADTRVNGTEDVLRNWDEIKKAEKAAKGISQKTIDVPPSMAALQRSHKIGEKTKKFGFDWTEPKQVLKQLKSEIAELEEVIDSGNAGSIRHEIGDVLFSAAQLARHLDNEPEQTLRETNNRFLNRFETMIRLSGNIENFKKLSNDEKERLWIEAKRLEK